MENKRQVRINIAAFCLLFIVSLYRQLSLRYLPDDPIRTYLLYACYVFLIGGWAVSIWARVTQKSMRMFLMLEAAVILAGMTVRFLQDTFWLEDILLMRVSGLCLEATIFPITLLGLYATLGTGQADSYKISKTWFVLLIPVILVSVLIVTDERHHLVNYIVPEETQPNLSFHPNFGTFLVGGFVILLVIFRVLMIYKKNSLPQYRHIYRLLIPFIEPILLLLFSLEFFVVSLGLIPALEGKEIIELYAKIYYAEILTWEIYIYLGLVPVNIGYGEIFRQATVGMQIIGNDGRNILSQTAIPVSTEQMDALQSQEYIVITPGQELHSHRFSDGVLMWTKDVSRLQITIDELNKSAKTLAQEGILLEEELKTKNQEARLSAKNQIYDELTKEIHGQLNLMHKIAKKPSREEDCDEDLRGLVLLGTFVKRRCNLRLIQKEAGAIHEEDLLLSIRDMQSAMCMMGIQSSLDWSPGEEYSADFSICIFDVLEYLLEYERFSPVQIDIAAKHPYVQFTVIGSGAQEAAESHMLPAGRGCCVTWQDISNGYTVRVTEGEA